VPDAVIGAAAAGVRAAIEQALGTTGPAHALLGAVGHRRAVERPDDAASHRRRNALSHGPTAAIAAVHRGVLADPAHDWSHLLAELRGHDWASLAR
jgi:uncharacterized protein GlcG (DUF336 family)